MASTAVIQKVVEDQVLTAAKVIEQQLDEQIDRLERLDEDDLEQLRERRLQQMKKLAAKRQEWLAQGHGEYLELQNEKEFFAKVVDKHLTILCKQHMETLFVRINAEKSPFLTEKLRVVVLPTLALIKDAKVNDYVVGFDELGGKDDFSTEDLEERLARGGFVLLDGAASKEKVPVQKRRSVRQSDPKDDSEDDE